MGKEQYNRYSLKKNLMKQVLFRIDYKGILEIKDCVAEFKATFRDKFSNYETTFYNTVDVNLTNIDDISESLSIPIKEIVKQEVHRFTSNNFGSDNVILDISKYFTTLTILCKEYSTIDDYLNFFVDFIIFMIKNEEYLDIKRFGLRKIGGDVFTDFGSIFNTFEKDYFSFEYNKLEYKPINSNHFDVLEKDGNSPKINFSRKLDKGIIKRNDDDEKEAYQVILDIDAHLDDNKIKTLNFVDVNKVKKIIDDINNNIFEIFKISVTEKYLEKNKIEECLGENKIERYNN